MRSVAALLALVLALAGCDGGQPPPSSGAATSSPQSSTTAGSPIATESPSAGSTPLPATVLRLSLLDAVGPIRYCDPDQFPVGRDETAAMLERWSEVVADPGYAMIAARHGVPAGTAPSDEQRLNIYRTWKVLSAIALDAAGEGFTFDVTTPAFEGNTPARLLGTIAPDGTVSVTEQLPAENVECPRCLARGTSIATPTGDVSVEDVVVGMVVWTTDRRGQRHAAPVVAVASVPAPASHEVVRLTLADGRQVDASAAHPLTDGRRLGQIRPADLVGGSVVTGTTRSRYTGGATFDILPAGDTGTYWANDIPLASTLR
jgi:hypothetical protein